MERIAFLIERSGESLRCMLNPESLEVRRLSGLRYRQSVHGPVTGLGLQDSPLLLTGGGITELKLDLLFDVSLSGSSISTEDVRDLTAPIFELAENSSKTDGYSRPPLVRFVWGKAWNIPGIVRAVSERLEQFTPEGIPRRSWLRMSLLRVSETAPSHVETRGLAPPDPEMVKLHLVADSTLHSAVSSTGAYLHEIKGGGSREEEGESCESLYELAQQYLGDSSLWRIIGKLNNVDNPLNLHAGTVLRIPTRSTLRNLT